MTATNPSGRSWRGRVAAAAGVDTLREAIRRLKADRLVTRRFRDVPGMANGREARSVIFLHHSFYHFYYLALALRRRGWRAASVSLEPERGINANFYHGEDINLFTEDSRQMRANAQALFEFSKNNFRLMHFAGDGTLSFLPWEFGSPEPTDILEWRRMGRKVAYTVSGCLSATAQSSVARWSRDSAGRTLCDQCIYQNRPDVCSDERNLAWGRKVDLLCDAIFSETLPALDFLAPPHKVIRGPHTAAMDESFWSPDIVVPPDFQLPRSPGEVLVFHAFGNYNTRVDTQRNIKGTPAVDAAIERLKHEGMNVRLIFATDMRNVDVRYYQVQADIIVDQLWAGRYGAAAREGMMLGKPVISYVNPTEASREYELDALKEVPLVSATVDTVYEVLKDLVRNPEKRRNLGQQSRQYALKWHGMAACAERYETAYDRLFADSRVDMR